jgi:hypothetical protein
MIFKITKCPKCGEERIHGPQTCGYQCSCGTDINEDNKELIRQNEQEQAEFVKLCCKDFDDFKRRMEAWRKEQTYTPFHTYSVPDKDILQFVKEKGEKK